MLKAVRNSIKYTVYIVLKTKNENDVNEAEWMTERRVCICVCLCAMLV